MIPPDLRLTLEAPPGVARGQTVAMTLVMQNTGSEPLPVYLQGRPIAVDLAVRRDGVLLWRRLRHATVPAILQVRELRPGERLSFELEWDQRTEAGTLVDAGLVELQGAVLTDAEPLVTPVRALRIRADA